MSIASKKKTPVESKPAKLSPEDKKHIEMHKDASAHFAKASLFHAEAAKYHSEGNHSKATQCALIASGHAYQALDLQKADAKHHAINN